MTFKIELSDSVIEAFRNSDRELFEEISDEEIRYGITAALEAMVECGMASLVEQSGEPYINTMTPAVTYPYIIIRLDGGKK